MNKSFLYRLLNRPH